jgi:putative transposase
MRPEYIRGTLSTWTEKNDLTRVFIQLDKPQQNADIERYNRTVRYDWLRHHHFESSADDQDYATQWL